MEILQHQLSSLADKIILDILNQLSKEVQFYNTDEETSFCEEIADKYYVYITIRTSEFEDNLVHEMCHLIQYENKYPMIKARQDIDENTKNIISSIQNIILDLEVDQRLKEYGYVTKRNTVKYDTYYHLLKKLKPSLGNMPIQMICELSVEILHIMIHDSKYHAESLLKYTDKCSLEIRKNVYYLYDAIKPYLISGINKSNIPVLYSELIGRLSDVEISIE